MGKKAFHIFGAGMSEGGIHSYMYFAMVLSFVIWGIFYFIQFVRPTKAWRIFWFLFMVYFYSFGRQVSAQRLG